MFTLTIETAQPEGKWKPLRQFQEDGASFSLLEPVIQRNHHKAAHDIIEQATKWAHEGGLKNPL